MYYTNESALIEDVYDYLFENDFDIGTNFLDEFKDSYVDSANACIYLKSETLGEFKIKMERISK